MYWRRLHILFPKKYKSFIYFCSSLLFQISSWGNNAVRGQTPINQTVSRFLKMHFFIINSIVQFPSTFRARWQSKFCELTEEVRGKEEERSTSRKMVNSWSVGPLASLRPQFVSVRIMLFFTLLLFQQVSSGKKYQTIHVAFFDLITFEEIKSFWKTEAWLAFSSVLFC